jgi:hypothetical protein
MLDANRHLLLSGRAALAITRDHRGRFARPEPIDLAPHRVQLVVVPAAPIDVRALQRALHAPIADALERQVDASDQRTVAAADALLTTIHRRLGALSPPDSGNFVPTLLTIRFELMKVWEGKLQQLRTALAAPWDPRHGQEPTKHIGATVRRLGVLPIMERIAS